MLNEQHKSWEMWRTFLEDICQSSGLPSGLSFVIHFLLIKRLPFMLCFAEHTQSVSDHKINDIGFITKTITQSQMTWSLSLLCSWPSLKRAVDLKTWEYQSETAHFPVWKSINMGIPKISLAPLTIESDTGHDLLWKDWTNTDSPLVTVLLAGWKATFFQVLLYRIFLSFWRCIRPCRDVNI